MQRASTSTKVGASTVHWIDHYVVCSEDVPRWEAFHAQVLGAETMVVPGGGGDRLPGVFQNVGRSRHGGFKTKTKMPPTKGLGVGLPRYGYYIDAADIDAHLRRLDEAGATHSAPVHTAADGEAGTAIYWQDPDGNQFEFWAPDVLPEGAMFECSSARVGRISHGVFESRDLERSAEFFSRFCGVERVRDPEVAGDTLVMRLGGGARVVYKKVSELGGRTTGMGMTDTHAALLVHEDDFFPNYRRLWGELPEWDFDPLAGKPIENPTGLPARTVLHPSPAGRRFHAIVKRGDDFFDWDTNLFHFYSGTPVGDSLAVYDSHAIEDYIDIWEREHNGSAGFREMILG
jgi:predicted enzyme related to lactoylglutathione lyase